MNHNIGIKKAFSTYMVAAIFQSGVSFLIFPFLTHFLNKTDFGLIALINTYVMLLSSVANLGCEGFFYVNFFKLNDHTRPSFFKSCYALPLLSLSSVGVVLAMFAIPLSTLLQLTPLAIIMVAVLSILNYFFEQILSYLVYEKQALKYSVILVSKTIIEVLITVYGVTYFSEHWQGRIAGWLVSTFLCALFAMYYFAKRNLLSGSVNKLIVKQSLNYGLPLVPHQAAKFSMNQSDRIFISQLSGLNATGIYNVAYMIGNMVNMVNGPFNNFFAPMMVQCLSHPDDVKKKRVVQVAYVYLLFLLAVVVGVYIFSHILYTYFIHPSFAEAKGVVPIVALAYFFWGIYLIFTSVLQFKHMTRTISIIGIATVVVNFGLNYVLIHWLGYIGAAWATLISFALQAIIIAFIAMQHEDMPWLKFNLLLKK